MDIKRTIKLMFPDVYVWYSSLANHRRRRMNDKERKAELCKLYEHYQGRKLDWSDLHRYTEKMQWKKLYYNDPLESLTSDKFAVRQWVSNQIGKKYLMPIIGVWDKFEDIDFSTFPDQFVLKTTHSSSNIIIVKDKDKFDKKMAALTFRVWLSLDYAYTSFEMHYKDIPRRIIAEYYMQDSSGELPDYKFLCFNGEPFCCWVDKGRFVEHKRDIFDLNWNLMPWTDAFPNTGTTISKPKNFDEMVEISKKLSKNFLHVRVDLYNIDGKVYFGELTFCESSGFCKINPPEYDFKLGEMWKLPINNDCFSQI